MLVFGVEIEFHVEDDPNPHVTYETPYQIFQSHLRGQPQGTRHQRHGELVREIHEITEGNVRVGYDATASFGDTIWDGYELSSMPLEVEETLEVWRKLYKSRSKRYLNADPDIAKRRYAPAHHSCGMHIHLSGDDVDQEVIERLSRFVNNRANEEFITHIAGRYNTQFCRIVEPEAAFFKCLFHSDGCYAGNGKIDRGVLRAQGASYCCGNAALLAQYATAMSRHSALNYLPNPNTGSIEFRLFCAPNEFGRAAANIQFTEALVKFCKFRGETERDAFCVWLEEDRQRRRYYKYLFRYLREAAFVKGLIPLR